MKNGVTFDAFVSMVMKKECDAPSGDFGMRAKWATDQVLFSPDWFRERSVLAVVLEDAFENGLIVSAVERKAKAMAMRDGVLPDRIEDVKVNFLDDENGFDVELLLDDGTVVSVVIFSDDAGFTEHLEWAKKNNV